MSGMTGAYNYLISPQPSARTTKREEGKGVGRGYTYRNTHTRPRTTHHPTHNHPLYTPSHRRNRTRTKKSPWLSMSWGIPPRCSAIKSPAVLVICSQALDKAALSHISKHCLPDARSKSFSDMIFACRLRTQKPLGSNLRTAPSGFRMSMPAVLSHTQVMGPMLTSNVTRCWLRTRNPRAVESSVSPYRPHVSSAKAPSNQHPLTHTAENSTSKSRTSNWNQV